MEEHAHQGEWDEEVRWTLSWMEKKAERRQYSA